MMACILSQCPTIVCLHAHHGHQPWQQRPGIAVDVCSELAHLNIMLGSNQCLTFLPEACNWLKVFKLAL